MARLLDRLSVYGVLAAVAMIGALALSVAVDMRASREREADERFQNNYGEFSPLEPRIEKLFKDYEDM